MPVRGARNTAYAEIADMNEFAVCTIAAVRARASEIHGRQHTHIQYFPRVDENPNRCDDERAAADVEEARQERSEVYTTNGPARDNVHRELREEESKCGEEDRCSRAGPAMRLNRLEKVVQSPAVP